MPQYYGAATCANFDRARPSLSGSPLKCLRGLPRGSKISEILEPFRKARGSKIEILNAGGATKNLGDFLSRGPSFRNDFSCDLFLFGCVRGCSVEQADLDNAFATRSPDALGQ